MKKAFFYLAVFFIVFSLTVPSLIAEETERKSGEANSTEMKIVIKDPSEKEQGKEIVKEEKIARMYEPDEVRDLIAEIRRQRDEIQSLRDEVARLRRLVEGQPEPEKPLIRRGNGSPPRRLEPTPMQAPPPREYREPERPEPQREIIRPEERRPEQVFEIESEIAPLEEKIADQPYNKEARIRLAEIYKKVGRKEEAIFQYNEVIRIASIEQKIKELMNSMKEYPEIMDIRIQIAEQYKEIGDLDNALRYYEEYIKLKGIGGLSEESKPGLDLNMGEVISSNAEEVVLKTFEGDTATFKVPKWQQEDGKWLSDKEISEKAQSLKQGVKVKIIWEPIEGEKVIRSIEFLNDYTSFSVSYISKQKEDSSLCSE
jgi:tetratricopeptide (TPR) repeat protein